MLTKKPLPFKSILTKAEKKYFFLVSLEKKTFLRLFRLRQNKLECLYRVKNFQPINTCHGHCGSTL
jgi:hypothetical protein